MKTLSRERDAAVTQLGVAFFTTEQLKTEKQSLSDQNSRLQAEIAKLTVGQEARDKKWQRLEENLREKIVRRDKMIHSLQEATHTAMNTSFVKQYSDSQQPISIEQPQDPKREVRRTSAPHARVFPDQIETIEVLADDGSEDITYLSVNDVSIALLIFESTVTNML